MRVLFTLAAVLLVALVPPTARASHLKEQPKKHKIVYHLDEAGLDKARSVLGNIENHIRVVGGAALRNFVTASMDVALRAALDRLQTQGLAVGACGNSMKAFNITLEQLPQGTRPLPQGGVVRVMELQEQGFVYLRP